jgi:predicted porin
MNAFYTNKSTKVTASFVDLDYTNNNASYSANLPSGNTIGTGLLPSQFGIGAKSRQNDLDVAFQFSFFTGSSQGTGGNLGTGNNSLNIRQAYLSFGDKSWGTIKMGRDLGVFGSDAILSDMTLLGVGISGTPNSAAGGNSTLGRIGSGYIYANWYGQAQYQSPNFNGFQVTAAVQEGAGAAATAGHNMGFAGKATYDFAMNDVTGRVWVGGITQKTGDLGYTSSGAEIGAKAKASGFELVGYYYDGRGLDSQFASNNIDLSSASGAASIIGTGGILNGSGMKTDDNGGYIQAAYTIPGVGTKLGASWGQNESEIGFGNHIHDYEYDNGSAKIKNESWIVGAYHPLTKHLNLVAEYTRQEIKGNANTAYFNHPDHQYNGKIESDTVSLGAILFF